MVSTAAANALVFATILHGSFTVPMKIRSLEKVAVDPFVFQTYKTSMVLATCWIGLVLTGEPFVYTPWGILGGGFWVIGSTCGIFAVRNAGIAASVGIWSAVIVLTSYVWGVIVFGEKVRSEWESLAFILLLATGLVGMSAATSPRLSWCGWRSTSGGDGGGLLDSLSSTHPTDPLTEYGVDDFDYARIEEYEQEHERQREEIFDCSSKALSFVTDSRYSLDETGTPIRTGPIDVCGRRISRRIAGMCCATMNGITAGASYIPLHYIDENTKGFSYVVSFAFGAVIAVQTLWIVRFSMLAYKTRSLEAAFDKLPSFHFRVMMIPACASGVLWSCGNIGNIYAVTNMGEEVGLSVGQGALIVSGLWGIFWYEEILETWKKVLWFASAFLTGFTIYKIWQQHNT